LSHLTFTQFLSERFALTGGKIDTSLGDANDYAHGVGDQQFMNSAFSLNPVTYLSSPYSTLGGGFVYLLGPEKQSQFSIMVYDGDGTIEDAGFDTLFEGRTTIGSTLRLKTNFFDKKGHHWFGFLYGYGDNDYDPQTQDPRILLPFDLGAPNEFEKEDSHWAFFYNFDQQLVSDPHNPERDWGLFGRFGMADEDTSVISTFYSIGLGGTGLFPSRPRDRFGVGYYYMTFTDDRVKQVLPSDDEQGVEIFYNIAVTPSFNVTADLQVIDGALTGADTAVIGGFRGRMVF
jgi:porin